MLEVKLNSGDFDDFGGSIIGALPRF